MEMMPNAAKNDVSKKGKRPCRVMVRYAKEEYDRLKVLVVESQKKTMAAYIRDSSLNVEERYFRAVKAFREFIAEVMRI